MIYFHRQVLKNSFLVFPHNLAIVQLVSVRLLSHAVSFVQYGPCCCIILWEEWCVLPHIAVSRLELKTSKINDTVMRNVIMCLKANNPVEDGNYAVSSNPAHRHNIRRSVYSSVLCDSS